MQNHYNLVYREEEREMMPLCRDEASASFPWSPLARGFLAGNRPRGADAATTTRAATDDFAHKLYYADADFDVVERVAEVARERRRAAAQVALAWLLRQPGVTAPIVGASKLEQLEEAVAGLSVTLTDEEAARLEEPYLPHRVLM